MEKLEGIQLVDYEIFKGDMILEQGSLPSFFIQGLVMAVIQCDADGTRIYQNGELVLLVHSPRMYYETIRAKGISEEDHHKWIYYNV
jgi:hypothetical protein